MKCRKCLNIRAQSVDVFRSDISTENVIHHERGKIIDNHFRRG